MPSKLSIPTADSVYFQVFDGQYVSDLFESLDEAKADADTCAGDENFSGEVEVVRFALCDGGDAGVTVYRIVLRPEVMPGLRETTTYADINVATTRYSFAVKAVYDEHGDRLNRMGQSNAYRTA